MTRYTHGRAESVPASKKAVMGGSDEMCWAAMAKETLGGRSFDNSAAKEAKSHHLRFLEGLVIY